MPFLDPKSADRFAKCVAVWRSNGPDGERAAARGKAELIAQANGVTLDQALAELDKKPVEDDIWAQFRRAREDVERRAREYRAAQEKQAGEAAEREAARAAKEAERERQRLERVKVIIAKYGSEEVALAPCWREKLIRASLELWSDPCLPPNEERTYLIAGECDAYPVKEFPLYVLNALAMAYPLPRTMIDIRRELTYWRKREDELSDLLDFGDIPALDLTAELRKEFLEFMAREGLPAANLKELKERLDGQAQDEWWYDSRDVEDVVYQDVEKLIEQEAGPAGPQTRFVSFIHDGYRQKIPVLAFDRDRKKMTVELACGAVVRLAYDKNALKAEGWKLIRETELETADMC